MTSSNTSGKITLTNLLTTTPIVKLFASAASVTDGGLIIIKNFSTVFASTAAAGTIAVTNQVRIYSSNSLLGNPVAVAYDSVTKNIYVAERLNVGGQVLTYSFPVASDDFAPVNARAEAGVTSIFVLRK
ncbi:hypothetical protein EKL32_00580 [Flavobacterium sp. GSN2]|nr:hypothetical protein EKL32_00580 [Flavobacterium sp. GSN2]